MTAQPQPSSLEGAFAVHRPGPGATVGFGLAAVALGGVAVAALIFGRYPSALLVGTLLLLAATGTGGFAWASRGRVMAVGPGWLRSTTWGGTRVREIPLDRVRDVRCLPAGRTTLLCAHLDDGREVVLPIAQPQIAAHLARQVLAATPAMDLASQVHLQVAASDLPDQVKGAALRLRLRPEGSLRWRTAWKHLLLVGSILAALGLLFAASLGGGDPIRWFAAGVGLALVPVGVGLIAWGVLGHRRDQRTAQLLRDRGLLP